MADRLYDRRSQQNAGMMFVRRVVPVVLLVLVVARMLTIVGDYRSARSDETDSGSAEATSSIEATASSGSAEGSADEQATDGQAVEDGPESAQRYVVVLIPGLNFRTEPKSGADIMRTLPEGTRLVLVGEENGWYQVRDDDGNIGWVSAKPQYVEVVSE